MRRKTESETGQGRSLPIARVRKALTPPFTDFFADFEKKKTDGFAV